MTKKNLELRKESLQILVPEATQHIFGGRTQGVSDDTCCLSAIKCTTEATNKPL